MFGSIKPLIPKNPNGLLEALLIGRLSRPKGTEEATQMTLASSIGVAKQYLQSVYSGDVNVRELAEQASGLLLDRETIVEAEHLINSGRIDVVIAEDLGRVFRNPIGQIGFVFRAVDRDTRVILVADGIDTADENWQTLLQMAVMRHGLAIPEQRRKTFRSVSFAFQRGGNVQKVKFGYRKVYPEEARRGDFGTPGLRIAKLPEATPVIQKLREILLDTRSWSEALDWLESEKVAPGPYVLSGKWSTNVLRGLLTDPILIGVRQRRRVLYKRSLETGILSRERNPAGPDERTWPELAHLTPQEFDSLQKVLAQMAEEHNNFEGKNHPRTGISRRKSLFPFQHAVCSICHAVVYSYNNDELKCQNTWRKRPIGAQECWNRVQTDSGIAREKILRWVVEELSQMPNFLPCFAGEVHRQLSLQKERSGGSLSEALSREGELRKERARLKRLLRTVKNGRAVVEALEEIDDELEEICRSIAVQKESSAATPLDFTLPEVSSNLFESVLHLSQTSYEFGDLMKRLLPRFEIVPVQDYFSGLVRPRAILSLRVSMESGIFERQREIDLFVPPLHVRVFEDCLRLKRENPKRSYTTLAERISAEVEPVSYQTIKRCFDLERKLKELEMGSPYRVLVEPPQNASRWRLNSG